jgi:ABC-type nitrate/sulfonate/bicarbonate transport system substrate-binding protein/2-polyprenyl-6-methoxyphenol hydroxylase-like FAD-dependent oxidoreductase
MTLKRKVAIIGAGIAGSSAALGLLNAGFDVTLYSDKERKTLRDGVAATGTAIYLGGVSQEADAEIIENIYGDDAFSTGLNIRSYDAEKKPLLEFDSDFVSFRSRSVDARLVADDRIGRFLERGGVFRVERVDLERLDGIASENDLTLVATGKGLFSELFEIDKSRTVYSEPQRYLLNVIGLTGVAYDERAFDYRSKAAWRRGYFNSHATHGEIVIAPQIHKDGIQSWSILGFAKPDGDFKKRFDQAFDAASALAILKEAYREYFPEDSAEIDKFTLLESDPYTYLKGAVTPLVRKAVGFTKSGRVVGAIGDSAIIFDPIGAQGAQNASVQVAALVKAAKKRKGAFDAEWLNDQFDAHWENYGHGATEVTRLFLGDPKYAAHAALVFQAAAVNSKAGTALFRLQSETSLLLKLQSKGAFIRYLEEATGESIEDLLARFKPSGRFGARGEAFGDIFHTVCPVPVAAILGHIESDFARQGTPIKLLQASSDRDTRESHFVHKIDNLFRQGGNAPALYAKSSGSQTKLIALSYAPQYQGLLALREGGINNLKDIKGKRLALPRRFREPIDFWRSISLQGYENALRTVGLSLSDVTLVDLPTDDSFSDRPTNNRLARAGELIRQHQRETIAWLNGEVDVIFAYSAWGAFLREQFSAVELIDLNSLALNEKINNGAPKTLTVSTKLLEEHPDLVENYLFEALLSVKWARENGAEARRIIASKSSVIEALLNDGVEQALDISLDNHLIEALVLRKEFLLRYGFIPNDFDVRGWIDPVPLERARKRFDKYLKRDA